MRAGWVAIAVLAALALAAGFAAQDTGGVDSLVPSTENRGPRGLAVLSTWLAERQQVVRAQRPLTELPEGVATVVIAAPSAGEISLGEQRALAAFVAAGGTLVYLAPRGVRQPAMDNWLALQPGELLSVQDVPGLVDPAGASAPVTLALGALGQARVLRLAADRQLVSLRDDAVPAAEHGALWALREGAGEIWVSAGADLAENQRLDALDNARFWAALAARGPLAFDEYHHDATSRTARPRSLAVIGAQLSVIALAFLLAFSPRLGPPREPAPATHRSATEYVTAMARLLQRARVDDELVDQLKAHARALAHERAGVPRGLDWAEAIVAARALSPALAEELRAVDAARGVLATTQALAQLERRLVGLSR